MKLETAIDTLTDPASIIEVEEFHKAVKLGIEALKRHQALQVSPHYTLLGLLPGETKE